MSVTLRARKNKNGTTSFRLDIYHNKRRWHETLAIKLITSPRNSQEREQNRENRLLADKIKNERARQLSADDYSIQSDIGKKVLVLEWMQGYINSYDKADKRSLQASLNQFKNYLHSIKKEQITFTGLTELILSDFQDYLRKHFNGETPASYFSRFKRIVNRAHRQKLITTNPGEFVPVRKGIAKRKEILILDELKIIYHTPCLSTEVKNAFLFSAFTGLAWVDIKQLKWKHINLTPDRKSAILSKQRSKNDQEAYINLNQTAISLLGAQGEQEELVYNLPSADGANKTIKALVLRAGINKKITWHNGRHSFATNLILAGVDLLTTSKLMAHATTKHTTRYVDLANKIQEEGTNRINIDLSIPQENTLKAVG